LEGRALSAQSVSRALIIANGDLGVIGGTVLPLDALTANDQTLVIAADGGLHNAERLGLRPALVVGDGDSLAPGTLERLREAGIEVVLHPAEKDESDTELALREALQRGAREIVLLGALGARFDHALANLMLLALPGLAGRDVLIVDGRSTVRLLADGETLDLRLDAGPLVSLLPLSERVEGVRTSGLRYPLDGETLDQGSTRGLSNEITDQSASVEVARGRLVVIQTHPGGNS
jgi:thiamine pyrophosphokinase